MPEALQREVEKTIALVQSRRLSRVALAQALTRLAKEAQQLPAPP